MKTKVSIDKIEEFIGLEIGVSEWITITQDMINKFADATNDHQFIHVDPDRARNTPFGCTIAHGFLTLSLLSTLAYQALPTLEEKTFDINYGFNKVRFLNPVKSGSRVRAHFILSNIQIKRPSIRAIFYYSVTLEVENQKKPALTADWITVSVVTSSN